MQQNPQNLQIAREKLLALLTEGIEPKEVVKDGSTTVYVTFNSIPFRETMFTKMDEVGALETCYERLYYAVKEHQEDPEGKRQKARQAYIHQWMDNITNGVADKNGEFVPSTKQVIERLERDGDL